MEDSVLKIFDRSVDPTESRDLLSGAEVVVTNDSGLMHVAAALDVPLIAIFGSTNPVTTGPAGNRQDFWLDKDI